MASAISSLPVPVSPLINTVASVGATTRTISSTRRRASLLPTMRGNPLPQSSSLSSATVADVASSISKDAVFLTAGASVALPAWVAILFTPLVIFTSLCVDPLADICWAVLQCDVVYFAALKEGDSIFIHQG